MPLPIGTHGRAGTRQGKCRKGSTENSWNDFPITKTRKDGTVCQRTHINSQSTQMHTDSTGDIIVFAAELPYIGPEQ